MSDDAMKTATDLFELYERYNTPAGWVIEGNPYWPSKPLGPSSKAPHPPADPSAPGEEATVEWQGRRFPRYFSLSVMRATGLPAFRVPPAEVQATAAYTVMLWEVDGDHVVRLLGTVTRGEDIDRRLSQLLRLRPLEWWKVKALIEVSRDRAEEAVGPDAGFGEYMTELMRPAMTSQVRRRNRITPALLKEVAEVYRAALAAGEPPTVAVEKHFTIGRANAAKWVARARAERLLGPAIGPTGGEGEFDE